MGLSRGPEGGDSTLVDEEMKAYSLSSASGHMQSVHPLLDSSACPCPLGAPLGTPLALCSLMEGPRAEPPSLGGPAIFSWVVILQGRNEGDEYLIFCCVGSNIDCFLFLSKLLIMDISQHAQKQKRIMSPCSHSQFWYLPSHGPCPVISILL